jgi:ribosomal protein L18E
MTRTRLIVGLITHILILPVTKIVREAKARLWAVVPLMMMMKQRAEAVLSRINTCINQNETASAFLEDDRSDQIYITTSRISTTSTERS